MYDSPSGQWHSYESLSNCWQDPPFIHGDGSQGTYSLSQFCPVYPVAHIHLKYEIKIIIQVWNKLY